MNPNAAEIVPWTQFWWNKAALTVFGGDARLTDLLQTLAACPKAQSTSIHDCCKARYEGLTTR
jgi:hypothetical protein